MSTQNFFAPPPLMGQPSSVTSLEALFRDAERVTHSKEALVRARRPAHSSSLRRSL